MVLLTCWVKVALPIIITNDNVNPISSKCLLLPLRVLWVINYANQVNLDGLMVALVFSVELKVFVSSIADVRNSSLII